LTDIEKIKDDDVFIPTPKQIKYARAYCDTSRDKNTKQLSEEINVSRQQIYRWRQDKRFMQWLRSKVDKVTDDSISDLLLYGIRQAKRPGGFNYWRTIMEIKGIYVPGLKLDSALEPPKIQFIVNRNEIVDAEDVKQIGGESEEDTDD
jgi:hypothetical protein